MAGNLKHIILSDEQVKEIVEMCKLYGVSPSRIMERMIQTFKDKSEEE